jgi:hypothetical protein
MGPEPLVEVLTRGLGRLRRGMTAVVITPSLDPAWVRPLARLRKRGVATAVCHLDPLAYEEVAHRGAGARFLPSGSAAVVSGEPPTADQRRRALYALRRELQEHDLTVHGIVPCVPLGDLMVNIPNGTLRRVG